MRLSKYNLSIHYVSEKDLAVVDDLSRLKEFSIYKSKNEEFSFAALQVKQDSDETQKTLDVSKINDMRRDITRLLFEKIRRMNEMTEQQWCNEWFKWLKDSWYEQIVEAKHNENIFELRSLQKSERKFILSKAKKYVLVQRVNKHAQLMFRERLEALSRCLHKKEIRSALKLLHEVHEHFSFDITFQRTLSRFYWFIRRRDVNKWCKTCSMC